MSQTLRKLTTIFSADVQGYSRLMEADEPAPFTGTAYVRQDGQVVFGLFAHGLVHTNENIVRDVSMTFVGAATFVGAVRRIDYDGDGAVDDEVVWEASDCKALVLP